MKPLGDGFIRLIKMIIAPVIFCTVVTGIAGMEDMKKVGRTGFYALVYFEVVSTIALFLGLLIVNVLQARRRDAHRSRPRWMRARLPPTPAPGKLAGPVEFLLDIIPSTVVGAFATGNILQVLLFSLLFGFALQRHGRAKLDRVPLRRAAVRRAVRASSE